MNKLLCILATAALFGACEQKTEVTTPAAPAAQSPPDPAKAQRLNRKTVPAPTPTDATTTTETKTETKTETTVTATPNP